MKHLICILILGSSFLWCSSQTQHLHASRIGLATDSEILNDRFGMVYEHFITMERVVNLGDTAALIHFAKEGKIYEYYHTDHHPIFNDTSVSLRDLKVSYPEVKDWIGFEKRTEQKEKHQEFIPFSFPRLPLSPFLMLVSAMMLGILFYYPTIRNEILA